MNGNCHIVCVNPMCGFVVHEDYYTQKPKFTPGLCAKCNSPIRIVTPYTREVIPGAYMVLDPAKGRPGQVVLPLPAPVVD